MPHRVWKSLLRPAIRYLHVHARQPSDGGTHEQIGGTRTWLDDRITRRAGTACPMQRVARYIRGPPLLDLPPLEWTVVKLRGRLVVSAVVLSSLSVVGTVGVAAATGHAPTWITPDEVASAGTPAADRVRLGAASARPAAHLPKQPKRPVEQRRRQDTGRPVHDEHTVMVRFRPGASKAAKDKALSRRGAQAVGDTLPGGFVKVRTDGDAAAVVAALAEDPAVAQASLDLARHATATPNDTYYATDQKYLARVRLPQAWDLRQGREHPGHRGGGHRRGHRPPGSDRAYGGRLQRGGPGRGADRLRPGSTGGRRARHDGGRHRRGEHQQRGGRRRRGVDRPGHAGQGVRHRRQRVDSDDRRRASVWAADHGAKVINMSLGGPGESAGAARGDAGTPSARAPWWSPLPATPRRNEPEYPAAYPEVLAVGATDTNPELTDFSTWGDWIDVAAPGLRHHLDLPAELRLQYATGDGTSFAAPMVSGIAALMRARYPTLTPAQAADRLRTNRAGRRAARHRPLLRLRGRRRLRRRGRPGRDARSPSAPRARASPTTCPSGQPH